MKLYVGPGFGTGIFLSMIYGAGVIFAALVAPLSESLWYLLLPAGFIWMFYNSVREFIGWFSMLPEEFFNACQKNYEIGSEKKKYYFDVCRIRMRMHVRSKSTNRVPAGKDFSVLSEIETASGQIFRIRAGQGPFTTFGRTLGAESSKSLVEKLRFLASRADVKIESLPY